MFKRIALLATLPITFLLNGCVVPPKDGLYLELPEPRPVTTDSSYAMKVATAIKTTALCLGCKDTPLWQDEKELASSARFHERMVTNDEYSAARDYRSLVWDLNKKGNLNKETLPPPPKVVLIEKNYYPQTSNGSDGVTTGLMLADSFDGQWTNPGASLGVGLALGFLFSSTPPDNDKNHMFPPSMYMKAAFVLPEKISFNKFDYDRLTPEEQELENATCFGATEFVRVMTKSAVDMGYQPIGDIRYDIRDGDYIPKPHWAHVYQPLENDAIGCPKVAQDTDRLDMCRVEFGYYTSRFIRHTYTNIYEKTVVPTILGGDGKAIRWIAHMGYRNEHSFGLIVDEAEKLNVSEEELNHQHAMGMQKYLKPGQFIYVPSYYLSMDEETIPCVLDHKGVHYFAVVVPQNRPATPEPTVQESTSTLGSTMTDWLKKATTF